MLSPVMPHLDDAPAPSAARVAQERALVGAALVDPVAATWLLAKAKLEGFRDPLAFRVFLALIWFVRATDAVHRAATDRAATDLELVVEDMAAMGDLGTLGGRQAVEALVAERPEPRQALTAVRAAAARSGSTGDSTVSAERRPH